MLRAAQLLLVFCLSGSFVRVQNQPLYTCQQLSNIYDPALYDYLQNVIDRIITLGPERFNGSLPLLIDRSDENNMYCGFADHFIKK